MRLWLAFVLTVALLSPLATRPASAVDVPEWLTSAASAAPRSYEPKVPAEVLLHDGRLVVDELGRVESRVQHVVRVLTRAGRREAVARVVYAADVDKLRELGAWVLDPRGVARRLGQDETHDLALARNDVYSEQRVRLIDASEEVQVGSVFGYESVVTRRSFFNQTSWSFQSTLPTRLSRLELLLPPGWTSQALLFNPPSAAPVGPTTARAWELRDLPFLDDEPGAPLLTSLVPRLALSYTPPPGQRTEGRSFASWEDVASWASEISDPRAVPDAALLARAQELTRGKSDAWQRLAALAELAQGLPYISIQVGFGRFQPHEAASVLAKQYGDCKDKVALLRALLKAVGIASYPLLVSSNDRSFVRCEWPSPLQFDHVMIAIALAGAAGQPAAIRHPQLGDLLLFDPTAEDTRLGDLPEGEQGGWALLAAGDAGTLVRVPVIPVSASRRVCQTAARLSAEGRLTAEIVERSLGQAAARERLLWRGQTRQDYVATVERWLADGLPGVRAERVAAADEGDQGFRCEIGLSSERYAQPISGGLLVFKPAIVTRQANLPLAAVTRQHPVLLHARSSETTERIHLPAGFVVDEIPPDVEIATPFGRFVMTVRVAGEELTVIRQIETQAMTLPVEEYGRVRDFFRRVLDAEQSAVVLVRR